MRNRSRLSLEMKGVLSSGGVEDNASGRRVCSLDSFRMKHKCCPQFESRMQTIVGRDNLRDIDRSG